MSSNFKITENGINSVLILDDDWAINFVQKELEALGVEKAIFDRLEDDEDPSTEDLITLLKEKEMPHETLQDKLDGLFCDELLKQLPALYSTDIVELAKDKKDHLKKKLITISSALIELGLEDDNIHCISTITEAKEHLLHSAPDLFIIDLFIENEDKDITIEFIQELLKNHPSSQFILMSYNTAELKKLFRIFHKDEEVPSSRFKVVTKPEFNKAESLRWKHAFYQLSKERTLMGVQHEMQKSWAESIDNAAQSLKGKIWELDSCSLNKLRLTALADNMKLSEYLPEIISKHILSEFENSGSPTEQINALEIELSKQVDSFTFTSSVEVLDAYEILKEMLADTISHRDASLSQFSQSMVNPENIEQDYSDFKSELKFGTVLRHKQNGKLLVHITQPCDYIHVPLKKADDESLLLFPGVEMSIYKEEPAGNKKFITPYIRVDDKITSIKWNLRRPITFSIDELFKIRNEYSIVGKIRDDYTQAISNSFASAVSRVATIRIPRFEPIKAFHLYFEPNSSNLFLSVDGEDIALAKNSLPFESAKIYNARRFKLNNVKNGRPHRIMLLGDDAAALSEELKGDMENKNNISLQLLQGASLGDTGETRTEENNNIIFSYTEGFKGNFTSILEHAKKVHEETQGIINIILIQAI